MLKTKQHTNIAEAQSFVTSGMKFIQGQDREQTYLFPVSLDDAVDAENEVRLIDVFVDSLKMNEFGFKTHFIENGRPAYHPADLLKLFIYGYLTQLRSSRKLEVDQLNINTLVAIPPFSGVSHAPDLNYDVEHFDYNPKTDTYTCPQGNTLKTTGYWHVAKNPNGEIAYRFRNYTTPKCKKCEVRPLCTKSAVNGKQVRRSEFATNIENNKKRILDSEKLYKRRQAIVEHHFGTIKRQWGFNYIITKHGLSGSSSDFGFAMVAYNLKRLVNIIGVNELKQYMGSIAQLFYLKIARLKPFLSCFVIFKQQLREETENALLNLNFIKQNDINTTQRSF